MHSDCCDTARATSGRATRRPGPGPLSTQCRTGCHHAARCTRRRAQRLGPWPRVRPAADVRPGEPGVSDVPEPPEPQWMRQAQPPAAGPPGPALLRLVSWPARQASAQNSGWYCWSPPDRAGRYRRATRGRLPSSGPPARQQTAPPQAASNAGARRNCHPAGAPAKRAATRRSGCMSGQPGHRRPEQPTWRPGFAPLRASHRSDRFPPAAAARGWNAHAAHQSPPPAPSVGSAAGSRRQMRRPTNEDCDGTILSGGIGSPSPSTPLSCNVQTNLTSTS
ncbi:hypothetical protein R77591_04811 [Ralstonia mannitolilytica]|uniref:Uncharacterized protein n=1 Tax=Ralstonia mannitolilytica TaxID=105219 RepID=A0AAD2B391_9RALS|nr:hypothetical protein R77591_04811 [Ralstonia mannitolilytica]CAJ0855093.1 hypothetical protein R77569_00851 [Ralstonia mannitolilytica]